MNVETVKIDSLTFDPANVRKHDEKNLAAIKASLNRFGQQKPIVVDASGVVRAGNGTLAAAKALGWKEIRIVRSSLAGSEATAYAIADNRTAELAEWDDDALAQTLAALQIEDDVLAMATGFDSSDIDAMIGALGIEAVDAPELDSGEKEPFQQMAFILHDSQVEILNDAIRQAQSMGIAKHDENENKNGNAISAICLEWINSNR